MFINPEVNRCFFFFVGGGMVFAGIAALDLA